MNFDLDVKSVGDVISLRVESVGSLRCRTCSWYLEYLESQIQAMYFVSEEYIGVRVGLDYSQQSIWPNLKDMLGNRRNLT